MEIEEIHKRNQKVAYIRSWQEEKKANKYDKNDIKKISLDSTFSIKKNLYTVAYDCTEYLLDGKGGDKWNYLWGGNYPIDFTGGDRFYIIMVFNDGGKYFFRMQLRGITIVELIEKEEYQYVRDRLRIFLSDDEIAQMLRFEEIGVVELKL